MKKMLFLAAQLFCAAAIFAQKDTVPTSAVAEKLDSTIFENSQIFEKKPQFPGGEMAMRRFLAQNVQYPKAALDAKTQGKVHLRFVVEKDGSISGAEVVRGLGNGCDEESLRVLGLMPKWEAASQNGRPVRVRMNLPVSFRLE